MVRYHPEGADRRGLVDSHPLHHGKARRKWWLTIGLSFEGGLSFHRIVSLPGSPCPIQNLTLTLTPCWFSAGQARGGGPATSLILGLRWKWVSHFVEGQGHPSNSTKNALGVALGSSPTHTFG